MTPLALADCAWWRLERRRGSRLPRRPACHVSAALYAWQCEEPAAVHCVPSRDGAISPKDMLGADAAEAAKSARHEAMAATHSVQGNRERRGAFSTGRNSGQDIRPGEAHGPSPVPFSYAEHPPSAVM